MSIHLQPELIEKVNNHILTIIKMPQTCYQAYKCLENSEAVMLLQKAAEAYNSSAYQLAITHYKTAIGLLKNTSEYEEESFLLTVIQYLICKCLINTSQVASLIEAKDSLVNLIEITETRYPMLYYLLSYLYVKTFCYKKAEKLINDCLAILSKAESIPICKIPTTNDVIPESSLEELSKLLVNLKDECTCWHRPDAVCFMKDCSNVSVNHLLDRDIYFKSPAFNGLVVVTCNNDNPCVFNFHIHCWKLKKEELSPHFKFTDKDFLSWKCFTPNCEDSSNKASVVYKIDIFNSDNTIKSHIELPEKIVKPQQAPKGAVRKQKISRVVTPRSSHLRRTDNTLNKSNNPTTSFKNDKKKYDNEKMLIPRIIRLIQARNSNYGIKSGADWRPDLAYYGDAAMIVDEEVYPDIVDTEDDNLQQKKNFLFSYFYEFVSCNAPVKKEILIKKWKEAKTLITDCDSFLYELGCPTIVEFLLKSMKFAMVGEYICTPATLPDAYKRIKDNVCGVLKCLMKEDDDSGDDLLDEELLESVKLFDISGRLDNKNTNSESSKNDKVCDDKEEINQPDKQEESADVDVTHTVNLETIQEETSELDVDTEIYVEETGTENEKMVIENENDEKEELEDQVMEEINSSEVFIENVQQDYQEENVVDEPTKPKICNKTCKRLQENLQKSKQELEENKNLFLNYKINVLKTMLYADYMSKKNAILFNIRILKNEYAIVDKLQTVLIYSVGAILPVAESEWDVPLKRLEQISVELDRDYYNKLGLLNDKEYCRSLETISCVTHDLPGLPNKDLVMLIQLAFNLYRDNLPRAEQTFHQTPNFPPGFNSLFGNPILLQQQQRSQLWQFAPQVNYNPQQFRPRNYTPLSNVNNNYPHNNNRWNIKPTNNKSTAEVNAKEFINYDELGNKNNDMEEKTHSFNYTEPAESLNNEKILLDFSDGEDFKSWKSLWNDKLNPLEQGTDEIIKDFNDNGRVLTDEEEEEEEIVIEAKGDTEIDQLKKEIIDAKPLSSFDKLMKELRARNRGVLEYDLVCCVRDVRKKYKDSLSGLTFARIISEAEELIPSREKLQLCSYNRKFVIKSKPKKVQKVKVSSVSSQPSIKVKQRLTSKDNPWATLDNFQHEWVNEDTEESECIICMETIVKFGKVVSYTLKCQHTFHKKCIKNWFNQNQTCPTCRTHCTFDDEFPPLS